MKLSPALAGAAVALALALPPAVRAEPVPVDRVVAVVNSEPITVGELDQRVRLAERQLRRQQVEPPSSGELRRQVLERMIVDRAQLQSAREQGIRVDDAQLDRAIGRMAEENGLSVSAFRDRIERDGIPFARFRDDLRAEIVMTRLREREVDARVEVSEAEVDAQLSSTRSARAPELKLAQILVQVPEAASPEQVAKLRARAEDLARQARTGGDFARLAAASSDAPDGLAAGGSLGWRTAERLPALFVDAVGDRKPGAVVGPVRSAAGFHVLKLEDRRSGDAAGPRTVVQNRARHILLRPAGTPAAQAEAQRLLRDLRDRLRARSADFADLARQYSTDGSAARGGDLGWLDPGDTVPEFDRAMQALQVGEISEPLRSQFGWHLIQVVERRTGSAADRERISARMAVRERKIEEQTQEWLRRLRDRTFVELRLD